MIDEATHEELSKRLDVPAVYSPKELRAFFHGVKLGRRVAHVSERDIDAFAVATVAEREARNDWPLKVPPGYTKA